MNIKSLYMILKNINLNKVKYIIAMFQILLVILIFNFVLGMLQNTRYLSTFYDNSELDRAIYAAAERIPGLAIDMESTIKKVSDVTSVNKNDFGLIANIRFSFKDNDENLRGLAYNQKLMRSINYSLAEGNKFEKSRTDKNNIPVIITSELSSEYSLGDIIKVNLYSKEGNKIIDNLEVIGILETRSNPMVFTRGGTRVSFQSLFSSDFDTVIMPMESLNDVNYSIHRGFLMFVEDNLDYSGTITRWKNDLNDIVNIFKVEDTLMYHQEEIRETVILFFSFLILLFFFALSGLGGNNALVLINQQKEYGIYFACGLHWRGCVFMHIIQSLVIFIIPTTIAAIIIKYSRIFAEDYIILSINNFIYSLLLIAVIFILTSIDPIMTLARKSPVSIIRRCE